MQWNLARHIIDNSVPPMYNNNIKLIITMIVEKKKTNIKYFKFKINLSSNIRAEIYQIGLLYIRYSKLDSCPPPLPLPTRYITKRQV